MPEEKKNNVFRSLYGVSSLLSPYLGAQGQWVTVTTRVTCSTKGEEGGDVKTTYKFYLGTAVMQYSGSYGVIRRSCDKKFLVVR